MNLDILIMEMDLGEKQLRRRLSEVHPVDRYVSECLVPSVVPNKNLRLF